MPTTAMVLAAGLGLRMRPLTLALPKPLVTVAGKTLLDWTLDMAAAGGIARAVINVHHLADKIITHTARRTRPTVLISDETRQLLDTGGGIVKALPVLGDAPFFVFNGDGILTDGAAPLLRRLADAWDGDRLDVLMLVHPRESAHGFDGAGDFFMSGDGRLRRRGAAPSAPFVYAGAYILHPRILAGETPTPFSMNRVWDNAIANDRMAALVHDGAWFHVGTPAAVANTEMLLGRMAALS
ncbi:MAG: nucleotidyltransferase family protein [Rhodospirillaceae bacterium]|nr:nucleotidyltransferase family protein [Rhodospirillaceae bacterium]